MQSYVAAATLCIHESAMEDIWKDVEKFLNVLEPLDLLNILSWTNTVDKLNKFRSFWITALSN